MAKRANSLWDISKSLEGGEQRKASIAGSEISILCCSEKALTRWTMTSLCANCFPHVVHFDVMQGVAPGLSRIKASPGIGTAVRVPSQEGKGHELTEQDRGGEPLSRASLNFENLIKIC